MQPGVAAVASIAGELERLAVAGGPAVQSGMAGFTELYQRFVTQPGPAVNWDSIEKLPTDSVS